MRVTDVSIHTEREEALCFSVRKTSPSDKFQFKAMVGMDADEVVPKFAGFGQNSGNPLYDATLNKRQIIIRLQINPRWNLNETYSSIRDDLYRAISSSRTGVLSLYLHSGATVVAKLDCKVTKFEVPLTGKIPEVQMTLDSDAYFLRGVSDIALDVSSIGSTPDFKVIDAQSTAPHGLYLKTTFTSAEPSFSIQDAVSPEWSFEIVPNGGFLIGDELEIQSDGRKKYATLTRSAAQSDLASAISTGSLWPVVYPTVNEFYIPQMASLTVDELKYKTSYWGI